MKRLGSEIPPGADHLLDYVGGRVTAGNELRMPLPEDCLPFSNGRAALAWLLHRKVEYRSALVCAYSCPSLVRFLRVMMGLHVGFFDAGASWTDMATTRAYMESPCLTIIPALFGAIPRIADGSEHPSGDLILIDAMQTAFAHLEVTDRWVLSGPRKCTGLPDGAILRFPGAAKFRDEIMNLPNALRARAWKMLGHRFWNEGSDEIAWAMNACAEEHWPSAPHRMHEDSLDRLERLDAQWHNHARRLNYARLLGYVHIAADFVKELSLATLNDGCAPFGCPILVNDPKALQAKLKHHRIYATRLFHDCAASPSTYPRAHLYERHLLLLPCDQRCDERDIQRIADAVRSAGIGDEKCQLLQHLTA